MWSAQSGFENACVDKAHPSELGILEQVEQELPVVAQSGKQLCRVVTLGSAAQDVFGHQAPHGSSEYRLVMAYRVPVGKADRQRRVKYLIVEVGCL
jgi:hypothetical protein